MCCQNPADHIFVDLDAESLGQVLGNLRTAKAGIASLEFTDGLDQVRGGPFGARLALRTGGVEASRFAFQEPTMEAQQGGGLEDNGGAHEPTRAQERRAEPEEQ